MSSKFKLAKERLEELGYDPVEALVEIARNRNNLAEIRMRAAIALLPYTYSQVPTKLDVNVTRDTGVMRVPQPVSEEEWAAQRAQGKGQAFALGQAIDVGPDGKALN